MTANVPQVTAWQPQAPNTTADELDELAKDLDERYNGLARAQDVLAETWEGPAASAAADRAAARILDGARQHLVATAANARGEGFTVHDHGVVDPSGKLSWLAVAPPETRAAARIQIEKKAAELSTAVVDALRQANQAATEASALIKRHHPAARRRRQSQWPARSSQSETTSSPGPLMSPRRWPHRRLVSWRMVWASC